MAYATDHRLAERFRSVATTLAALAVATAPDAPRTAVTYTVAVPMADALPSGLAPQTVMQKARSPVRGGSGGIKAAPRPLPPDLRELLRN